MLKWEHIDIDTEQDMWDMVDRFNKEQETILAGGFDTETTGLHHMYDVPFLFQFGWCCPTQGYGVTYAIDLEEVPELARRTITVWHTLAQSLDKYLAHNVNFDLHMLSNIDIPYRADNISDTMIWMRLGSDAVPTRKGGVSLKLKDFAQTYIDVSAKDMDKELQEERSTIASEFNLDLKKQLGWTKKKIDEFFKDKLHTVDDLPEHEQKIYKAWYKALPDWIRPKVTGSVNKDDIPYHVLNRKTLKKYAHLDIVWLLEAYIIMKEIVTVRDNLEAVRKEEDNIYVLLDMERVGLKIDFDYLCNCRDNLKTYIIGRREDLCRMAGQPLKCSQSKLILNILNSMGVAVTSTNADELDLLLSNLKHEGGKEYVIEFIETIQELRTLEKWYSTYIMRFILDFNEADGKIYTRIHQTGTVSGRVTSDFQQFPKKGIKGVDGTELFNPRRMVTAIDGDFIGIVYLDYSQIELRLQAFYTILVGHADLNLCRAYMPYKCHTFIGCEAHQSKKPFDYNAPWCIKHAYDYVWYYDEDSDKRWEPLDVHGATTKVAFSIDEDAEDFHDLRYIGKRVNFAKNYGAQRSKISQMFPEFDEDTITKIDNAYYLAFPGVKLYHEYCYQMARTNAYMQNLFGVKYYGASGHNLINMLVQGTGAYYLKWKKVQVVEYLKEHKCKSVLMMEIHDELQFKWHKDDDPQIFFDIKAIMEDWEDTKVPIVADMELTKTTWAEKIEINSKEDFYGKS